MKLYLLMGLLFCVSARAKQVEFKWKPIEGAKKYQVEVSTSDDFEKTVFSESVKQPIMVKDLPSGIYYMRVRAYGTNDKRGRWSSAHQITVTPEVFSEREEAKIVKYFAKAPPIKTEWVPENEQKETDVIVSKDGRKFIEEKVSGNTFSFQPDGSGKYVVAIRTNIDGAFGKPTIVNQVAIEEEKIEQPRWRLDQEDWIINRPIELEWSVSRLATNYIIKVHKNEGSDFKDLVFETRETQYKLSPLPEGTYKVTIQSASGGIRSKESEINIVVSSAEMLKVKKAEVEFGLGYGALYFNSQFSRSALATAINNAQSYRIYGRALINLSQSNWKLDVRSSLTTLSFPGAAISASEFQAAPGLSMESGLCASCKFLMSFGPRLWATPVVARSTASSGVSVIESSLQTLLGPVINLELQSQITNSTLASLYSSLSTPVYTSQGGRDDMTIGRLENTFNYKIGLALQVPVTHEYSARLSLENESQKMIFTRPNGDQAITDYNNSSLMVGVTSTVGAHQDNKNLFSEFDLSLGSLYERGNIESRSTHFSGTTYQKTDFYGTGLSWRMRGDGWFKDSRNGLRAEVNWKSFGGDNRSGFGYTDYISAWKYMLRSGTESESEITNYFGLGTLTLPVTFENLSSQRNVSTLSSLGFIEGVLFTKSLTSRLQALWQTELYYPMALIGYSGGIQSLNSSLSYKSELTFTKKMSSTFAVNLGFGYKIEELRYRTEFASVGEMYTVQRAPYLSLLGILGF